MKAIKRKEIQVTLILDEEEAKWLKSLVQNPLKADTSPKAFENEDPKSAEMRKTFWEALTLEGI
jgi:outer membrane protein assembly factor BamE (lipoprotein component of BamABCDE complex)